MTLATLASKWRPIAGVGVGFLFGSLYGMIPKIGVLGFTVALDGFSRCGMVPMGPFVSLYGIVPVGAPVLGLPVSLCGIVPLGPVGGLVVVPSLWGTVPQLPEPVGGLPVPVYGGRVSVGGLPVPVYGGRVSVGGLPVPVYGGRVSISGVGPVGGGPVIVLSL